MAHASIRNTKMMPDPILQGIRFYRNKQYKKAFKKLEPEARVGNDIAQNYIWHMYFYGLGVEQDYRKALKWYKKSAGPNTPWGIYYLGVVYSQGCGVKKDFKTAYDLFFKSADRGVSKAQYNLGVMYLNGIGAEINLNESFKWIEMAAKQWRTIKKPPTWAIKML